MSTIQYDCAECGQTNTVEEGQESDRCSLCGNKHTPPWPGTDDTQPEPTTDERAATVEAPASSTIRITIEVVPGEGQ